MTQHERFFRLMRRWAAVNRCMESLSETEKAAIESLFVHREGTTDRAHRLGLDEDEVHRFTVKACAMLSDMLYDPEDEE